MAAAVRKTGNFIFDIDPTLADQLRRKAIKAADELGGSE
jgi:hypothetical protein